MKTGKPFYQQQGSNWYLVHPSKEENWKPGDGWVNNKVSPGFKTLRELKNWYQIYRAGYWYTSTTDKKEAEEIATKLLAQGYTVEIKIK